MPEHIEVLKKAGDVGCRTYELVKDYAGIGQILVKVSFLGRPKGDGFRVVVKGPDFFRFEKIFKASEYSEAMEAFLQVIERDCVDKKYLKSVGFKGILPSP
jgi:hypothetical protein